MTEPEDDGLTEFERGMNAGLKLASDYHEAKAVDAGKVIANIHHIGDDVFGKELALAAVKFMMYHREHCRRIWRMRKLTTAEKRTEAAYDRMDL